MAQIFPPLSQIEKFRIKPQPGELHLLSVLSNTLDDTYEVYFQPFVDGDVPDVAIMRQGSGVLIIEVKDWDLRSYSIADSKTLRLSANPRVSIRSPLAQVRQYRDHFYQLHIDGLLESSLKETRIRAVVKCAVYFHNASTEQATRFFGSDPNVEYVEIIGNDSLSEQSLNKLLYRTWLSRSSKYFTHELYTNFQRYFQPTFHHRNQGKEISYSQKQKELIFSRVGEQKVTGVVGSGKTRVLAGRAVAAHKRTSSRILVLTYNITLRNLIRDRISDVKEDFYWDKFYITNYHRLIYTEANNLELEFEREAFLTHADDPLFLAPVEGKIRKYPVILIDEIQDYKTEWIRILKRYFLADEGEFVVFGDAKQNIYQRQMASDKLPNTTIPGRWNELRQTHRLPEGIVELARRFQETFLIKRYDPDGLETFQRALPISQETIEYCYLDRDMQSSSLAEYIVNMVRQLHAHPNDIAVIGSNIEFLRAIDAELRKKLGERTTTTFETLEFWKWLQAGGTAESGHAPEEIPKNFGGNIERIRQYKKYKFNMNPGTMKIATMHSFKGWEIETLFVVLEARIEDDSEDWLTEELIYTAFTRSMKNLIILNLGNTKYDTFFRIHLNGAEMPG